MDPKAVCDMCENKAPTLVCNTCKKNHLYCTDCFKTSHNVEAKRMHTTYLVMNPEKIFTSFDDVMAALCPSTNCEKHPARSMDYVCKKCRVAICSDCLLVGEHKGHEAVSFEEGWNTMAKDVAKIEEKISGNFEKVNNLIKVTKEHAEETKSRYGNWETKVTKDINRLQVALESRKALILTELKRRGEHELSEVEKTQKELSKIAVMLERRKGLAQQVKVAKQPTLFNDLKTIDELVIPDPPKAEHKEERGGFDVINLDEVLQGINHMDLYDCSFFHSGNKIPKGYAIAKTIELDTSWPFIAEDDVTGKWYVSFYWQDTTPLRSFNALEDVFTGKQTSQVTMPFKLYSTYCAVKNGHLYFSHDEPTKIGKASCETGKIVELFDIPNATPRSEGCVLEWNQCSNILVLKDRANQKLYVAYKLKGRPKSELYLAEFETEPKMELGAAQCINLHEIGIESVGMIIICDYHVLIGKHCNSHIIDAEYNLRTKAWEPNPAIKFPAESNYMAWIDFLPKSKMFVASDNSLGCRLAYFQPHP